MTDDPSIFRYVELVKQEHRTLAGMERSERAAQLSYSSIDEDFVPVLDALGQVRMSIGRQPDETYAIKYVAGDAPPAPAGIVVAPREGAALVSWDGSFVGGYSRPGDFARIDIHASETPDFMPTGATVVGHLMDEAATLIPIDHVTHYFKLVVVNLGDVRSVASTEFSVLPEPIGTIAAGVIGANQLAATIVLSNKFIAGDPNASRVELDGTGIACIDSVGVTKMEYKVADEKLNLIGELATSQTGSRIVIDPAESGSGYPTMYMHTVDGQYGPGFLNSFDDPFNTGRTFVGLNSGRSGPGPELTYSRVWLAPDYADFEVVDENQNPTSHVRVHDDGTARIENVVVDKGYLWIRSNGSVNIASEPGTSVELEPRMELWDDAIGNRILEADGSIFYYDAVGQGSDCPYILLNTGGANIGFHSASTKDVREGISIFENNIVQYRSYGDHQFRDANNTAWAALHAASFNVQSSINTKHNFQQSPDSGLSVLRNAPVSVWQYRDQPDGNLNIGPVVEQLPQWLWRYAKRSTENDESATDKNNPMLSLMDIIGVVMDAIRELDEEMDQLRPYTPHRKKGLPNE